RRADARHERHRHALVLPVQAQRRAGRRPRRGGGAAVRAAGARHPVTPRPGFISSAWPKGVAGGGRRRPPPRGGRPARGAPPRPSPTPSPPPPETPLTLALQTAAPEARVGLFATGAPGRRPPPRPVPTAVSARKPLAPRRSNVALLLTGPPKQGSSHGPARSHPPLLRRRRGRRPPGPAGQPRRADGPPPAHVPVVPPAR